MLLWICLFSMVTRTDAEKMFAKGEFRHAADAYLELLKGEPSDPYLLLGVGDSLVSLREYAQAIPYLRRALSVDPSALQVARSLAAALQESNQFLEANALLTQLTSLHPEDSASWYRLGMLMYRNGYYGAAVSSLERALSGAAPGNFNRETAEETHALALAHTGDISRAEGELHRLLEIPAHASSLELLLAYAGAAYETGHDKEAMRAVESAAVANPANAAANFWLARLLYRAGSLPAAAEAAEKARDLDPTSPAPHNLLIRIYQKQGRSTDALREAGAVRELESRAARP